MMTEWTHSREQVESNLLDIDSAKLLLDAEQATTGTIKQFTQHERFSIIEYKDGRGFAYVPIPDDD